jgi:hypothetical protein
MIVATPRQLHSTAQDCVSQHLGGRGADSERIGQQLGTTYVSCLRVMCVSRGHKHSTCQMLESRALCCD